MNVEIAICTYNRCRLLSKTLGRLAEVETSAAESVKIIIVDNNCSDGTTDVIRRFEKSLNILTIKESRQGQVFARNAAIEAAQGDLLIWTDDDVLVGDYWFQEYVMAAINWNDYSFWGGPINPVFEESKPKWIVENWDKICGCFAQRELGAERFDLTRQVLPYGANFAIRTNLQKKFHFAEQLGRTDEVVLGEDELTLFRSLLDAGHQGMWLPNAKVDHVIDATRTTTQYVGGYFRGQGRALVLNGKAWSQSQEQLEKERDHELRCFNAKRFFAKSDVWLSHLIRGSLAAGQIEALRDR